MNIIVLLKQIPDTASLIRINDDGKTINTDNIKWIINPYDEFAVEEALQIKEKYGATVTIVSVGPKRYVDSIRKALAMGADKAILIDDPKYYDCDAFCIANICAGLLKDISYDIIIAGQRGMDLDQYNVPIAVAELLNLPQITMVTKVEIKNNQIFCDQSIDGGKRSVYTNLPVLITTQRGLNNPRFTSMAGIMKAKKKPLEIKDISQINIDALILENKTKVLAFRYPPERKQGIIIQGESLEDKAEKLINALQNDSKVI